MAAQILRITDTPREGAIEFVEHDPRDVQNQLNAGEAILVDVREVSEYENERIPGAFLMPLSFFEAEHFPYVSGPRVILMCAVGKRSAAAAKQLMNAGFGTTHHMKGGLTAWKAHGLSTDED